MPLTKGFLVESVEPGSPASKAGITGGRLPVKIDHQSFILGGDIIMSINDIALKDDENMQKALDLVRIGAKVKLKIFRKGKIVTSELAITERPLQPGDVPESSQSFTVYDNKSGGGNKVH